MNALTQEWVDKAEKSWNTLERYLFLYKLPNAVLGREHRVRTELNYGAACLMARNCAKEYLLARLQETAKSVIRQHDTIAVMEQVLTIRPEWSCLRAPILQLECFVNGYRFPDEPIDRDDAKEARRLCALVRRTVRPNLGLPV